MALSNDAMDPTPSALNNENMATNSNLENHNSYHSYTTMLSTTVAGTTAGFTNTTAGGLEVLYKNGRLPKVIKVSLKIDLRDSWALEIKSISYIFFTVSNANVA